MAKRKPKPFFPIDLLHPEHAAWPRDALSALAKPPPWLEISGALPDLSRTVAIVGTRFCDPWAFDFTRKLAAELASQGVATVSGGAVGIDTAAHEGALDANGQTIVILPTGIENPYPAENRGLFARVIEGGGCLISEGGRMGPTQPHSFLDRNRIIAALGQVLVVTQAPQKSGALSTAGHAKALGRPILAVPAAPWDSRGAGGLGLLEQGAKICRTAQDVLSLLACEVGNGPARGPRRARKVEYHQGLDPDQNAVLRGLLGGPKGADDLCDEVGLTAPRTQRAVLMLLLSGVIREVGSGRYERTEGS